MECLFVNREKQLFLSIYVDDLKLAGKAKNLSGAWAELRKYMDLEPPVPLNTNVYLGCGQKDAEIRPEVIKAKQKLFKVASLCNLKDVKTDYEDQECQHLLENTEEVRI